MGWWGGISSVLGSMVGVLKTVGFRQPFYLKTFIRECEYYRKENKRPGNPPAVFHSKILLNKSLSDPANPIAK
jgi:hypothetical protein